MVRDCVANVVSRLETFRFDPRRVGDDAWEARCPAHRSADHALFITRNEFNHLVLECRSANKCAFSKIIGALGMANEHVFCETPDRVVSRLSRVPIQPSCFAEASPKASDDVGENEVSRPIAAAGSAPAEKPPPSTQTVAVSEQGPGEAMPSADSFRPGPASEHQEGPLPYEVVPLLDSFRPEEIDLQAVRDGQAERVQAQAPDTPDETGFPLRRASSEEPGDNVDHRCARPGFVAARLDRAVVSLGRRPLLRPGSGW